MTTCVEVCGDGKVVGKENCDTGYSGDLDGCVAGCELGVKPNWTCQ